MAIRPPWEERVYEDIGVSRRKPWAATVLSFLQLGVGHVYVGSPFRGLVFLLLIYSIVFSATALHLWVIPEGMFGIIGVALVLVIIGIVDSVLLARKRKKYKRKGYNHWAVYLLLTLLLWGAGDVITTNKEELLGHGSYKTSSSMLPTLTPNDYFITDSKAYKAALPKVGDVVVFLSPEDASRKMVGRIMGLAGDVVKIKKGNLLLNNKKVESDYSSASTASSLYSTSMDAVHVPEHSVFILADNRDNSVDSRIYGAVPFDSIVGKVEYIWFSYNFDRIGMRVQ